MIAILAGASRAFGKNNIGTQIPPGVPDGLVKGARRDSQVTKTITPQLTHDLISSSACRHQKSAG
jgi:hypothetical protein